VVVIVVVVVVVVVDLVCQHMNKYRIELNFM